MPVVPMFTREPRRRRLATAPTVGHARLGRAIHAARGRRGVRRGATWTRSRGSGRKRTSSGLDGLLIGVEDLAAVGVELAVDAVDVDTSTPDRLPR